MLVLPIDEVARRTDVNPERNEDWEKTGKAIPFGNLKTISRAHKTQVAVFLMDQVPDENLKKPNNYQNPGEADTDQSKDVRLSLKSAIYFQKLAREFYSGWEEKQEWIKGLAENDHIQTTGWIRKLLDADLEARTS